MKAFEVLNWLNAYSGGNPENTVDTIKAGSDEKEAHKVAFCFIATPSVIRAAHAWGADVLITHEPTYYDHRDVFVSTPISDAKKKLIEESGMTLYRWHDHPHLADPDVIHDGFLRATGVEGTADGNYFTFAKDTDATAFSAVIEERLGIRHVRIIGQRNARAKKIYLCLGAHGTSHLNEFLESDAEIMVTGETTEWRYGYTVADAAELGFNKSLLLLGHCGSERDGMMLICDKWNEAHPDVEGKYFECGELYSYTD